jgi:predicted Zn finger-like uncharacterized protein
MSASITQCPECATRFRVSEEQLASHDGMVRCGRCNEVFHAIEHLRENKADPQLSLPIEQLQEIETAVQSAVEIPVSQEQPASLDYILATEPATLADQILQQDKEVVRPPEDIAEPVRKPRTWLWAVGSLLLLLVFLAQVLYLLRVELAAQLPSVKSVLTGYCDLLKCSIPLPQKAELMSIESSDMEADPIQSNIVTLSASLRNRASYIQAYPNLELSLTDLQDKAVVRRILIPAEYLKAENEKTGFGSNREISIQIHLDTMDLKPAGYKLFLFYPKQ